MRKKNRIVDKLNGRYTEDTFRKMFGTPRKFGGTLQDSIKNTPTLPNFGPGKSKKRNRG